MQHFAAPKLLQQMMVELHGLASSVPVIVAMESSTQAEIISISLATLFTDIGVHLMAFYFATSQVFEMMQPIMNAIMSCAKSKSHRVPILEDPLPSLSEEEALLCGTVTGACTLYLASVKHFRKA